MPPFLTAMPPAVPARGALRPAVAAAAPPVPRTSGAHGIDKSFFLDVNHFAQQTGWLHGFMVAYANVYGVVVLVLLLVAGWWFARRMRSATAMAAALWAGAGTIIAVGVAQFVNHAVAEARPWESLPHALILAGHSTDFSFPSDHAVVAGAVIAGLFLYHRALGIVATAAGLLLCFGRVYIGAHYPQDVAAGLVLGAAVVLAGYAIVRVPLTSLITAASRTPVRVLLASGPDPLPARGGGDPAPGGTGGSPAASGRPGPGAR